MLCVKNETIEDICPIVFIPSLSLPESSNNRFVVYDYSKDEKLLSMKPNCYMTLESDTHKKKFMGFAKYLRDRKKAAVIRLSAVDKVYILPPVAYETNFDRLNCYKVLKSLHDTKISDVSITCNASTSPSKVRTTDCTVSLPSDRPPSPPPPPNDRALGDENVRVITATSNKQGAGTDSIPSSFLSSLFEEAAAGQQHRQEIVNRKQAMFHSHGVHGLTAMRAQPQVTDHIKEFEDEMRLKINRHFNLPAGAGSSSDKVDKSRVLTFEPMEKQFRYIIHDLVSTEYGNILETGSAGEREERHVVAYYSGHIPEDLKNAVEAPANYSKIQSVVKHTSSSSTSNSRMKQQLSAVNTKIFGEHGKNDGKLPPGGQITQVGLVKRDRRTIEEIQADMKRRKMK